MKSGTRNHFSLSLYIIFSHRYATITLRSLALLSRRSHPTWLPFLLANVELSEGSLDCFYWLMRRDPRPTENLLNIVYVEGATPDCSLASQARGLILGECPNLQSLTVLGAISFPLAYYDEKLKTHLPLKGIESLKKIKVRWDTGQAGVSYLIASNILWILSLPNLKEADLDAAFYPKDVRFLLEHSKGWKGSVKRHSNVKNLLLKPRFMDAEGEDSWDLSECIEAIQDLLSFHF